MKHLGELEAGEQMTWSEWRSRVIFLIDHFVVNLKNAAPRTAVEWESDFMESFDGDLGIEAMIDRGYRLSEPEEGQK